MMTKLRFVVMIGLTLSAFCSVAAGDDGNGPIITKLNRNGALNDMALEVYGKNFGSDAANVKVSIDGKPCMLTFVSDTTIMLLTPTKARIGKTTLLLTVKGKKSNPFPIEILDRAKLGKDYWKRETERMEKSDR
ncbi:MAG: IPT/TIG domain-containing protein, partial [Planctomycetota bacterium]|nr:IPT/TIG domain-containing protein [Planctomycetota bacterium]